MIRKKVLLLAMAVAALGAGASYAGNGTRDVYTDGAGTLGPRDPYTDGGKAARFDIYTDGATVTYKRDVAPEVLATSRPNDCAPNCGGERQAGGAEVT